MGARLSTDLTAAAKGLSKQKEHVLASKGSYSFSAQALAGGTFTVTFSGSASSAKAARVAKATAIAKGSKTTSAAGKTTIKLKLTKAGKKLLRRGRRVKGTLKGTFAVKGGVRGSSSKAVTLKRR